MLRSIALVISVVFQPLIVPTLVFGLLLYGVPQATSVPAEIKGRVYFLIVSATLLVPMLSVFGLRLTGSLRSLHMPETRDRRIPFVMTTLFFVFTTWFLKQRMEFDPTIWQSMAVISSSVVVLTAISFVWKMSAHMMGLGGLLAVVVLLGRKFPTFEVLYPLLIALVLCGMVASARLFLHAHRPMEVYVGWATGFLICWLGFSWIWA